MKKVNITGLMLLQKKKGLIAFFAIALFSVLLINPIKTSSASFEYKDFNWEEFAEANKSYWDGYCSDKEVEEEKEECQDEVLKSQEKFYKKFYKIMAKAEEKGKFKNKEEAVIVENIILETVFYELSPSTFSDDGAEYKETWETESGAYVVDESDMDDPKIDVDYEDTDAAEYYSEENDTLKILFNNMLAYTTTCYGIMGDPLVEELDDGSKREYCENGGKIVKLETDLVNEEEKCVHILGSREKGFWEYFLSRWKHDVTLPHTFEDNVLTFLGKDLLDKDFETCSKQNGDYEEGTLYVYEQDEHISTDRYFDFLSYNEYFDKKAHLQEYFKEEVLDPAGVSCMTNDVCEDSLEAADLYDKYEAEIILSRREIIYNIIEILNNYGFEITYTEGSNPSYIEANNAEASRRGFYWPIGSDETEERGGIIFADKDPASVTVNSYTGSRVNPVSGENEWHYGIDITGTDGVTNVIAVYTGEVISIISNCTSGNYSCNEGYGNTVIISHANGDYTVYAHLASVDSKISVGTSVVQGQVIGKVGSTGNTNTSVLHYELRVGGNDISFSIDPLSVTSPDNPRPQPSQGDFSVHTTTLTREEFVSLMRSYCNTHSCESTMLNVFVANAGEVYDTSIENNVNPELVVIRAKVEGFSPGGGTNNYWGIRCYNGAGAEACSSYGSLSKGIAGFASVVSSYNTVSEMMSKYAYIGAYWYNPGSWALGGCAYYPYIKDFMSAERSNAVNNICNAGPTCSKNGESSCTKTIDEDQQAYATWQVNKKMAPERYNIFGL